MKMKMMIRHKSIIWKNNSVSKRDAKETKQDREICACTLQQRSHSYFSSFFLQELYHDHSKDLQKVGKYDFDTAGKIWQRNKIVLFNCHFLVFPNHVGGNHWTTIIVNMHKNTITHYNSLKVRYYNTSKGETHYAKLDGILQHLYLNIKSRRQKGKRGDGKTRSKLSGHG